MSALNTFSLTLASKGPEETFRLGRDLGKACQKGDVIALKGDLGSGKTLFIQGLSKGLGIKKPADVRSPTFSLIHEYKGKLPLCHSDLYRLSPQEIPYIGLEEYWQPPSPWVVAIEWADHFSKMIPSHALWVEFKMLSMKSRTLKFSGPLAWKKRLIKNG